MRDKAPSTPEASAEAAVRAGYLKTRADAQVRLTATLSGLEAAAAAALARAQVASEEATSAVEACNSARYACMAAVEGAEAALCRGADPEIAELISELHAAWNRPPEFLPQADILKRIELLRGLVAECEALRLAADPQPHAQLAAIRERSGLDRELAATARGPWGHLGI